VWLRWQHIWFLGLGAATTVALAAGDTARVSLQVLDTVDVCGRRECVLVVTLSPVQARDSLMGFNLAIRFNPEKLIFHAMLTSGTLAEGMDQRGFGAQAGELRAYAFTLTRTISGAQPLVAFVGEYRQQCPDTAGVQLLYVEFNEEFERQRTVLVDTLPLPVVARAVDVPGRLLRTRAVVREWEIREGNTSVVLPLAVEYDTTLRLAAARTVIGGIPEWLSISDVSVTSGTLQSWEQQGQAATVSWSPQGQAQLAIRFEVQQRKTDTAVLSFLTEPHDSCSCVTRWEGDSVRIFNTSGVSVAEWGGRTVLRMSGHLCLEPGEALELYDLLGREQWRGTALEGRRCVPLQSLSPGVYVGRWHRFGESFPVVFCVQ